MVAAEGGVGALVFADQLLVLVLVHLRCPLHHDPVLGAVRVHLQRDAGAGVDADLLDLPALAFGDTVVAAPGLVVAPAGLDLRCPFPSRADQRCLLCPGRGRGGPRAPRRRFRPIPDLPPTGGVRCAGSSYGRPRGSPGRAARCRWRRAGRRAWDRSAGPRP